MIINTDMALEFATDMTKTSVDKTTFASDVEEYLGVRCTRQDLTNQSLADKIGKRMGVYYTYQCLNQDADIVGCMASGIKSFHFDTRDILLVGIGNPYYTVDSLGNEVLDNVTIKHNAKPRICKFKPLCSGETGIESFPLVKSAIDIVKPSLVIAIDSLVTNDSEKLGTCYQITNTGLIPASGIGASRRPVTREELGVDVLAIGVPLALNVNHSGKNIVVTATTIDKMIKACAKNIAESITIATL